MNTLCLSRRNLLVLLSKLDRKAKGEETSCAILKLDDLHPEYPCTVPTLVVAVPDELYYNARTPGEVHPSDEPKE